MPIASAPTAADPKAAEIDEESQETEAERAKEEADPEVDTSLMNEENTPTSKTANETPAKRKVKRVIMPVPKRNEESAKPGPGTKAPVNTVTKADERPRRVSDKP